MFISLSLAQVCLSFHLSLFPSLSLSLTSHPVPFSPPPTLSPSSPSVFVPLSLYLSLPFSVRLTQSHRLSLSHPRLSLSLTLSLSSLLYRSLSLSLMVPSARRLPPVCSRLALPGFRVWCPSRKCGWPVSVHILKCSTHKHNTHRSSSADSRGEQSRAEVSETAARVLLLHGIESSKHSSHSCFSI